MHAAYSQIKWNPEKKTKESMSKAYLLKDFASSSFMSTFKSTCEQSIAGHTCEPRSCESDEGGLQETSLGYTSVQAML